MPVTTRIKSAKRSSKRSKPWYRRKYSPAEIAHKALAGVNYIRELINVEKKTHDATVNSTYDYTGAMNCLTQIAGGSGPTQRNGNSILMKGISIRGSLNIYAATPSAVIRFLLIQDLSPNPGTLTTAEVLEQVGTIYAPYSPLNQVNRTRYQILATKLFTVSTSGDQSIPFKMWVKLNSHCRWNSSTATDYDKGHIYSCIVSNTVTNNPQVTYFSRVFYYDN